MGNKMKFIFLLNVLILLSPKAFSSCFVDVDLNCSSINKDFEWTERNPLIRQHLLNSGEVQLNYQNCMMFAQLIKTECQISKPLQAVFVDTSKNLEVTEFVSSIDNKLNKKTNLPQAFINYFNDQTANKIMENNSSNLGVSAEVILSTQQKALIEQFINVDRSATEMKLAFPCSLKANTKLELQCGITLTCTSANNSNLGNQVSVKKGNNTYNSNNGQCSDENIAQAIVDGVHSMGRTANTALDLPTYSFTQFSKMPRIYQSNADILAILKDRYNFIPKGNDISLVVAATMLGVALRTESPAGVIVPNIFNNIDPLQKNVPSPKGPKNYNNYAAHVAEVFHNMLIHSSGQNSLDNDYGALRVRGLFANSDSNSSFLSYMDYLETNSFPQLVNRLGEGHYGVESLMSKGKGVVLILANSPDQKFIGASYAVAVQGFKTQKWKETIKNPHFGLKLFGNLAATNTTSPTIQVERSATVLTLYTTDNKVLYKTVKSLSYYHTGAKKSYEYSVLSDYNKEPHPSDPIIIGGFSATPWPLSSVAVAQERLNSKAIVKDEIVKSLNCSGLSTGTIKINNIDYVFTADPSKQTRSCGDLLTKTGYPNTSKKESYQGHFTYSCNAGSFIVQKNNCFTTKLNVCAGPHMDGGVVNANLSDLTNIKYSCDNFTCKDGFVKNGQSCTCSNPTGLKLKNGSFVPLVGKAAVKCTFTCPTGTVLSGDTCVAQGSLCDYSTPASTTNSSAGIFSINANDIYGTIPTEFGETPDLNAVYEYVPGRSAISGFCKMLSCKDGYSAVVDSKGKINCTQNTGIPNKQINKAEYVNFNAGREPGTTSCRAGFIKDYDEKYCASALNPCEYGPNAYGFKTFDARAPKQCVFVGCKTGYKPIKWTASNYKWNKPHLDSTSNNGLYPMSAYGYYCSNNKDDYALDGVGIVRKVQNQIKIIAATTDSGFELLRYLVKNPLDMNIDTVFYLGTKNNPLNNLPSLAQIQANNTNYEFLTAGSVSLSVFPQSGIEPRFDSIGSIVTNPNCDSWNLSIRPLCSSWKLAPARFEIYNCLEKDSILLNDFSCLIGVSRAPSFSSCMKVVNGVKTFDNICWGAAASKILTLNQKKTRETLSIPANVCLIKNGVGTMDTNKVCKASTCNFGYRLSQGSCIK